MEISNKQLKAKVRNLQQQLRRCKTILSIMIDIINNLKDNLVIKTEIADRLHYFPSHYIFLFTQSQRVCKINPTFTESIADKKNGPALSTASIYPEISMHMLS